MSRKRHKKKKKPIGDELSPSRAEGEHLDVEAAANADDQSQRDETPQASPEAETGEPGGPADTTPPEPEAKAIKERARLETEVEELRELLQRKQAEFANYRKRVERERTDIVRHAASELMKELLPVLDNLERAIAASDTGSDDQFREGVQIIYRQFKDTLERQGLEEVETESRHFDPYRHEAVSRVATSDYPEGSIVEVLQKGYRFKDRLLRPAMVSVARPADDSLEADGGSEDEVIQHRK